MSHLLTRRRALTLGIAARFVYAGPALAQPSVVHYQVLTKLNANMPLLRVATCADLQASLNSLDEELARVKAKPEPAGEALLAQLALHKSGIDKAIGVASKALADGKIDEAFAAINGACSLYFIVLGASLTAAGASVVALGVAAAASVLVGAAVFGVQAYFKQGSKSASFVIGFGRDRAFMFAELAGQQLGKALIEHGAQAAALFAAAYEYANARNDQEEAKTALAASVKRLEQMKAEVAALGNDKKKWGEVYANHLKASRDQLSAYITMTKAQDCVLSTVSVKP